MGFLILPFFYRICSNRYRFGCRHAQAFTVYFIAFFYRISRHAQKKSWHAQGAKTVNLVKNGKLNFTVLFTVLFTVFIYQFFGALVYLNTDQWSAVVSSG